MFRSRYIKFKELILINEWRVKTYTISEHETFDATTTYDHALLQLPDWLNEMNSFNPSHDHMAFIIVHKGSEGVFTLINTWVGDNMLQIHIYISKHDLEDQFQKISGDGLFACVWELEVINHERNAWIKHILKHADNPNFDAYVQATITTYL